MEEFKSQKLELKKISADFVQFLKNYLLIFSDLNFQTFNFFDLIFSIFLFQY